MRALVCVLSSSRRELFTVMLKAYERCSLMGCSIEPDPNQVGATSSHLTLSVVRGQDRRGAGAGPRLQRHQGGQGQD